MQVSIPSREFADLRNPQRKKETKPTGAAFQSLPGNSRICGRMWGKTSAPYDPVSIPSREFADLRSACGAPAGTMDHGGFNPFQGIRGFAASLHRRMSMGNEMFQSLPGNSRICGHDLRRIAKPPIPVSIPSREFADLREIEIFSRDPLGRVSIPSREFADLRRSVFPS